MSKVERSNGRPGRPLLRWVAAGSAAAFLLSSAYSVSWGQGINGENDPDDDDDGLSAAEIAGIAVGGLAAGYGLWLLLGASDDDDDEEEQKVQLPEQKGGASAVRLVPDKSSVDAGDQVRFDLQVRSGSEWVSVTERDGASVTVATPSALVQQDGAKNSFCLPITAAAKGEKVVVEGRFQQANGSPLVAQTTVQLN